MKKINDTVFKPASTIKPLELLIILFSDALIFVFPVDLITFEQTTGFTYHKVARCLLPFFLNRNKSFTSGGLFVLYINVFQTHHISLHA